MHKVNLWTCDRKDLGCQIGPWPSFLPIRRWFLMACLDGGREEGGRVKGSRVELVKNKLILC